MALIDPGNFTPAYDAALACGLAAAGAEVHLISQVGAADDGVSGLPREEWFYGLSSRALRRHVPLSAARLFKGVEHVFDMLRMARALRERAVDVVHFQWLALPLVDNLHVRRIHTFAPTVITVHDSVPYNGAGSLVMRLGHKPLLHAADALIVHTEETRVRLLANGCAADRVHKVLHGLLHRDVHSTERQRTLTSKRPLQLLLFGKIKPYKGINVFLEALSRLPPDQRARLQVRIVGKPYMPTNPFRDLITRHGLESVVDLRLDFVPEAEINTLFAAADVLICPYLSIDASGVAMTAMAQGVPLVASRIGMFAEQFGDGRAALLVPPGKPEALAAALARLIAEPELLDTLRQGMLTKRAAVPSWDRIGELTMAVYDKAERNWRLRR